MILNLQKSCLFLQWHWKFSSRMHIGETLTHHITFHNNCRLFGGALLWMTFRDKWMDYLHSEVKTWLRGTKNIYSGGQSLCLPIPKLCLAHTHFSHLFWNIIELTKNNENKYTYIYIYIWYLIEVECWILIVSGTTWLVPISEHLIGSGYPYKYWRNFSAHWRINVHTDILYTSCNLWRELMRI